jgi:hypothetical protein
VDGKDRRKYPRQPTRRSAQLTLGDQQWPCEIRDFCRAGVFLDVSGAPPLPPITPGFPVSLCLSGDGAPAAVLEGRAVRVEDSGLGLRLDALPDAVFEALCVPDPEQAAREAEDAGMADETCLLIRQECTRRFSTFLDGLLQDFFPCATSSLLDAGYEVTFLEQSR